MARSGLATDGRRGRTLRHGAPLEEHLQPDMEMYGEEFDEEGK
jgi:hypothetical protein